MSNNSRLISNTKTLRENLVNRNLYVPNAEYPLQSNDFATKTISVINSIIGGITPFKSYNIEDSVLGRIANGENQSPLSLIGLAMLGKQMALNSMSHIAQKTFPIFNVSNLFDGNKDTKLVTFGKDYNITLDEGNTKFSSILKSLSTGYSKKSPFDNKNPSNDDYIKNTGKAQLEKFYTYVNMNLYKQNYSDGDTFYKYSTEVNQTILSRKNTIIARKKFFSFDDVKYNPYNYYSNSTTDLTNANDSMNLSYNVRSNKQEYGYDSKFTNDLGTTKKSDSFDLDTQNTWIPKEVPFKYKTNENTVVWGRDGVDKGANKSTELQGNFKKINVVDDINGSVFRSKYNVYGGLLEYTRNLVNATQGNLGDLTRKAFREKDKYGFNGSGLWKANNTKYANAQIPGNDGVTQANKTGVRQHSALDQYDRFAKAIRFNGNNVYNGNPNSVIYNTVMPRIHPTDDANKNKNLMFSIENLAIHVSSDGIIDDEYGSQIPLCEVGQLGGRIMWFPPYGLEINETATAKFEPTIMVGRNEPMYNYQNSERSATLNFTLLVDYPPQVRNYSGSDTQREIAEFFAFGGDPNDNKAINDNLEKELNSKIELRDKLILKSNNPLPPNINKPEPLYIYFPNDIPKPDTSIDDGNLSTIIDTMYNKMYEIDNNVVPSDYYGSIGGINSSIYYIGDGFIQTPASGSTKYVLNTPTYSQYTSVGLSNESPFNNGSSLLNKMLFDVFTNSENRKYYAIRITGSASQLHTDKYNMKLGYRRATAAKNLIIRKLETMLGDTFDNLGIKFEDSQSVGESQAVEIGESKDNINVDKVKRDRYAKIEIVRLSETGQEELKFSNDSDKIIYDDYTKEIESLQTQINNKNKQGNAGMFSCYMNEKKESNTAILDGFSSISGNYFYPIFHSQTPEDFHKRLTFLHQCTRQGSAKRYDAVADSNGTLRARNSVFGRQPICVLRIGDFFHTKIIIESINFDYTEMPWDMNPEGFGMQPMMAKITMQIKIMGGQSLKAPIDALQNAVSFNYYANSTYTKDGMYLLPSAMGDLQDSYNKGVTANSPIVNEFNERNEEFKKKLNKK